MSGQLTIDAIEGALLEAAAFEHRLPQVRAPGYQMFWPKIVYDPVDWGYQALQLMLVTGKIDPDRVRRRDLWHVAPRRDVHDLVMMHWLGRESPLDMLEKTLVWCRVGSGQRLAWRKVAKVLSISHEQARREYVNSLIKLQKWLAKKNDLTVSILLR